MIVELDPDSPIPPYEQIRAQLATMIESGVLPPGTRLPSMRQLAADLELAINTVARSYRELETSGLVVSRVRHGTVVADHLATTKAEIRERLNEAARTYRATTRRLGINLDAAIEALHRADNL